MIIKNLIVNNLFSYYGVVDFNLAPVDGRPITVILGRTGFGKTSFINSLKLVFVGVNKEIRSDVERHRLPSYRQYIEGDGSEWLGIRNRKCLTSGASCSVEARWDEDYGEVSVKRVWNFNKNDQFQEELLEVNHPLYGTLEGSAAQKYLNVCLPEDYVPFFFFDGEELEELAEANRNATIERMEQLLNIKSVENIREALKQLMSGWKSEAMDQQAKADLNKEKNRLAEYYEDKQSLEQELGDIDAEIARLNYDIKDISNRMSSLNSYGSKNKEIEFKAKLDSLRARQADLRVELSQVLGHQPFLLLLPTLVEKSISECESVLDSKAVGYQELINSVREQMTWALTQPPHSRPMLTPDQSRFYLDKLNGVIDLFKQDAEINSVFSLDTATANGVLESLRPFSRKSSAINSVARDMTVLQTITSEISEIEKRLLDVSHLSDEEQRRFKKYEQEIESTKAELLEQERRKISVSGKLNVLLQYITKADSSIKHALNRVEITTSVRQRLDLASNIERALGEYKSVLKSHRRQDLEEKYNEKFKLLMDSHGLIEKIEIDDAFNTHYFAGDGRVIGLSSISAGMKQLSATALIWTLGEISGKSVPVVIDTPLGRIDRLHQLNLLKKYYPVAGEQVVLLPTDSELDEQKYGILSPFIARTYLLNNPSGDQTSVQIAERKEVLYG